MSELTARAENIYTMIAKSAEVLKYPVAPGLKWEYAAERL